MSSTPNYFLQTIENLRHYEEVMLYASLLSIKEEHEWEVIRYLQKEFEHEKTAYPGNPPGFDSPAALWAAKTVYTASQLMLYREHKEEDLSQLLPAYNGELTAGAHISVDLVLRFLPDIVKHLQAIDPEDALIPVLLEHLCNWHYSGIKYSSPVDQLNFESIVADRCLHQLYVDRVIEYRRNDLANHPAILSGVKSSLGIFGDVYWNGFRQNEVVEK